MRRHRSRAEQLFILIALLVLALVLVIAALTATPIVILST